MIWIYNNKLYESFSFDWEDEYIEDAEHVIKLDNSLYYLVFHPKWDKCFWTSGPQISGNGNKLKFYLIDVYNENKFYYCEAKNLELVAPQKIYRRARSFYCCFKISKNL